MSYVRMGDGSDVYLIGCTQEGRHVIECCGCIFIPMTREEPPDIVERYPNPKHWARGLEWYAAPFPAFTRRQDALAHLDAHRAAGHEVPDYAYPAIRGDDWLEDCVGVTHFGEPWQFPEGGLNMHEGTIGECPYCEIEEEGEEDIA